MGIKLADQEIQLCYRIGRINTSKVRGILLKLNNLETKELIYKKKKLLKGTGIVVREDLTSHRVALMDKAIQKLDLKSVWTDHGKIT